MRSEDAMQLTILQVICAVMFSLAALPPAHAQSGAAPPELENFAAQYVAAINAKDAAGLQALYGSESRACIAAEDRDFYDTTLAGLLRDPIPTKHTVTVSAVDENNLRAIEAFGKFPRKPERELHIDYQQGDDLRTVVLYLVEENGRWVADQPCPTADAIKKFHENAAARARYKALAQSIHEPLRSELIGLLRQYETGSAIDRYHQASGEDMQTSMLVINALRDQLP
jgi:hypothetical protein